MLFRFIAYGLLGMIVEIIWTSIYDKISDRTGNWKLRGYTYLWMFPIYGMFVFLFEPLSGFMENHVPFLLRGAIYSVIILKVEFLSGYLLKKLSGNCPWDYTGKTKYHICGYIRLDYFIWWGVLGLLAEPVSRFLIRLTPYVSFAFHGG